MTQYSTNTLIPINTSVISKYRFCLRNYFVEIWLRARKCVDCPRVTWPICLEIDAHSSYVVSHFLNQQEHIITWRFSFKIRILWFSYIPCAISLLSYNLVWMQSWLRHMAAVDANSCCALHKKDLTILLMATIHLLNLFQFHVFVFTKCIHYGGNKIADHPGHMLHRNIINMSSTSPHIDANF